MVLLCFLYVTVSLLNKRVYVWSGLRGWSSVKTWGKMGLDCEKEVRWVFPSWWSYTELDNISDMTRLVLEVIFKGQNPHVRNPTNHTYTHMFTFKQTYTAQETQMAAHCWAISHMHAWTHTLHTAHIARQECEVEGCTRVCVVNMRVCVSVYLLGEGQAG